MSLTRKDVESGKVGKYPGRLSFSTWN